MRDSGSLRARACAARITSERLDMAFLGFAIGLITTVIVAYMVIKKYKPQAVLIVAGVVMLLVAIPITGNPLLDMETTTGNILLDVPEHIRNLFSSTAADLGLVIMSVGGFALLMDRMGASEALVRYATKPLSKIKRPYIILGLSYIVGQLLAIIIPSASGLGLLLMVTMYPLLRSLGISRLSAAAVIATSCCLDLGPASSNSNMSAEISDMTVQAYFLNYQGPVAIVVMVAVATLHIVVQRHYDKKAQTLPSQADFKEIEAELQGIESQQKTKSSDAPNGQDNSTGNTTKAPTTLSGASDSRAPGFYALLPLLPLVLVIVFSEFVIEGISMDVATSMILAMLISLLIEVIRYRSFRRGSEVMSVFFEGMGKQFVNIVTLIVAGQVFAAGLTQIGFIDYIITGAQNLNFGVVPMTILMSLIILLAALVTGSGNAAWFAFAPLAPQVAQPLGEPTIMTALPMELSAGIGRSMSPIAGVVIAVAGLAGVSPVDLVKRTIPVMIGAWIVMEITSFIWLYVVA